MKSILLVAGLLAAGSSFAQTIPNPGFETWATAGPFEVPTGWAISPAVKKSSDAHSGSWALQCTVDTFTNPTTSVLDTIIANAYTGVQTMGPPTPGANVGGYPFSSRPDSIMGYYKFQGAPGDTLMISVVLSHWNLGTSSRDVIGQATFTSNGSVASYTKFIVPLTYTGTGSPDTAVIHITPANPQGPKHMGSSVWVDDLAFVTIPPAGIGAINRSDKAMVFPNPFTDNVCISLPDNGVVSSVRLVNALGQVVARSESTTVNTSSLPIGIYFAEITSVTGVMSVQEIVKGN